MSDFEYNGRFGHHPHPAIDFCIEVEELTSIIADKELGLRTDEEVPIVRYNDALDFRVGGDVGAVKAKFELRLLGSRITNLLLKAVLP